MSKGNTLCFNSGISFPTWLYEKFPWHPWVTFLLLKRHTFHTQTGYMQKTLRNSLGSLLLISGAELECASTQPFLNYQTFLKVSLSCISLSLCSAPRELCIVTRMVTEPVLFCWMLRSEYASGEKKLAIFQSRGWPLQPSSLLAHKSINLRWCPPAGRGHPIWVHNWFTFHRKFRTINDRQSKVSPWLREKPSAPMVVGFCVTPPLSFRGKLNLVS